MKCPNRYFQQVEQGGKSQPSIPTTYPYRGDRTTCCQNTAQYPDVPKYPCTLRSLPSQGSLLSPVQLLSSMWLTLFVKTLSSPGPTHTRVQLPAFVRHRLRYTHEYNPGCALIYYLESHRKYRTGHTCTCPLRPRPGCKDRRRRILLCSEVLHPLILNLFFHSGAQCPGRFKLAPQRHYPGLRERPEFQRSSRQQPFG